MNTQINIFSIPDLRSFRVTKTGIGWIALVVMLCSSATYYAFAKVLTDVLSPMSLIFVSELISGVFCVLTFGFLPLLRSLLKLKKRQSAALIVVGALSGIAAPMLLFTGLARTSAVNATLFGNAENLFLLVFAALFLGEHLHKRHYISIGAILAGLLCVSMRGFSASFGLFDGDILVILSGALYGLSDMIFRKYLHEVQAQAVIVGRSLMSIAGFAFIAVLLSHSITQEIFAFPLRLLPILLGFGFLSRFVNLFNFYQAIDRLPVAVYSLSSHLSIIFSILFANWFLLEPIQGYQLVGGAAIIFGALYLEVTGYHPSRKHHLAHLRQRHASRS